MKTHWLYRFEQEQELQFYVNYNYPPATKNPLENLSMDQLLEKIESGLGTSMRPFWNELKKRIAA